MEVGPGEIKNVAVLQSGADLHADFSHYAVLRNIIYYYYSLDRSEIILMT